MLLITYAGVAGVYTIMYVLTTGIYIIEELPEDGGRDVVDLEDVWSLSR